MHHFRFSLLTLFGFVAVVAITCAALARPSQLWLVVVSSATLACLFYSVLAAVYGRNARCAFCLLARVRECGFTASGLATPTAGCAKRRIGTSPDSLIASARPSLGRSSARSSILGENSCNLGVGHGLSQMIIDADLF
jgi:hypothetical protein